MKLHSLIAAAAMLIAATAQAHDCSGGADGGMDATGNQCTDSAGIAAAAVAPAPVSEAATPAASAATTLRTQGLAAYERGHDAEAMSYFRRAAESGDARSAEILALMYRSGPRLYSAGVRADPAEAAKWAAIAAEARRREAAATLAAR